MYVAKAWRVASTYPMTETTRTHGVGSVPGGSLIADDGTYPMRAVIRVVADPDQQLWSTGSNQALLMPQGLHITHSFFYAVHPEIIHRPCLFSEVHSTLPEDDETDDTITKLSNYKATTRWGTLAATTTCNE